MDPQENLSPNDWDFISVLADDVLPPLEGELDLSTDERQPEAASPGAVPAGAVPPLSAVAGAMDSLCLAPPQGEKPEVPDAAPPPPPLLANNQAGAVVAEIQTYSNARTMSEVLNRTVFYGRNPKPDNEYTAKSDQVEPRCLIVEGKAKEFLTVESELVLQYRKELTRFLNNWMRALEADHEVTDVVFVRVNVTKIAKQLPFIAKACLTFLTNEQTPWRIRKPVKHYIVVPASCVLEKIIFTDDNRLLPSLPEKVDLDTKDVKNLFKGRPDADEHAVYCVEIALIDNKEEDAWTQTSRNGKGTTAELWLLRDVDVRWRQHILVAVDYKGPGKKEKSEGPLPTPVVLSRKRVLKSNQISSPSELEEEAKKMCADAPHEWLSMAARLASSRAMATIRESIHEPVLFSRADLTESLLQETTRIMKAILERCPKNSSDLAFSVLLNAHYRDGNGPTLPVIHTSASPPAPGFYRFAWLLREDNFCVEYPGGSPLPIYPRQPCWVGMIRHKMATTDGLRSLRCVCHKVQHCPLLNQAQLSSPPFAYDAVFTAAFHSALKGWTGFVSLPALCDTRAAKWMPEKRPSEVSDEAVAEYLRHWAYVYARDLTTVPASVLATAIDVPPRKAAKQRTSESHQPATSKLLMPSVRADVRERLLGHGLKLFAVPRDGTCLFHSFALYRNVPAPHLRRELVEYLASPPGDQLRQLIEASQPGVLGRLRNEGEWAGQEVLIAAARYWNSRVVVIAPGDGTHFYDQNGEFHQGLPAEFAEQDIFVAYNGNDHYDALVRVTQA